MLEGIENIKDGGAALTAYGRLMYEDMPQETREAIEGALKEYCELDTLVTVFSKAYGNWSLAKNLREIKSPLRVANKAECGNLASKEAGSRVICCSCP